ncbi:hypothetical protein ACFVTE_03620 [Arthrobacter sp. NPDC058097]|uniref:hypothetical protein n=1 Tax=Arthrobacter sp. NPDC058097 TaxID=3346340 RepID=UPI0036D7AEFC
MTWYERPLASGQPELIGPYIDFGGADMKIVTASLPYTRQASGFPGRRTLRRLPRWPCPRWWAR